MFELSTINLRDTLGWWFSMTQKKMGHWSMPMPQRQWLVSSHKKQFLQGQWSIFWCFLNLHQWTMSLMSRASLINRLAVRKIVILKQKGNQQLECVHSWWSTLIHLNSSPRLMFLTILSTLNHWFTVSEPCESGKLLGYFEGPQCQNPTEGGRAVFSRLSWALSQTV